MPKSNKRRNDELVPLSTLIPKQLNDKLHRVTERKGMKVKAVVTQAIEQWLKRELEETNEDNSHS